MHKEDHECLIVGRFLEHGCAYVVFLPPPLKPCAPSSVHQCGDERWLQIVMVFAPLIYVAHAVCLARPDCVDGDTSIFCSGWGGPTGVDT